MATTKPTYQSLKTELDDLVTQLQRDETDVDAALEGYARGLKLVKQLEDYLKSAENKIIQLQPQTEA